MPAKRRTHPHVISARFVVVAAASLLALLHLVGRWDFARIVGGAPTLFSEPRLWIGIALLFLTVVYEYNGERASRRNNLSNSSLFVPMKLLTVFVAYMVSTAFWSDDPSLALVKVYDYLFLLVVVWLIFLWNYEPELSVWFWTVILVVGVALAILALVGVSPGSSPNPNRLSTLGGGPNVFGRNMGLVSLLCLYFAFRSRQIAIWAAVGIFMVFMIVLTGSRGALISTICAAAILILIELSRGRITRRHLLYLGAVGIVALTLLLQSPYGSRIVRFFNHRLIEMTLKRGYTAGRDVVYLSSLEVIQENPIFGIGLESFYARELGRYPHNLFLETLVEGGLVGGLLLLAVGFAFGLTLWKHRHHVDSCGVAALVQAFLAAQVSGDIYDNRGVLVFFLLSMNPGLRVYADKLMRDSIERARGFLRQLLISS